jgi:hypothetical protein
MLAIDLKEIDFDIAINPIQGIPEQMGRVVRRIDTNTPLGVVGLKYRPVTHKNAFGGAIEAINNSNIDTEGYTYDLRSHEYGALASLEINFPAHTARIGTHDLSAKYIARNSYNGTWKFQSFFGWMNNVCFNTMVVGRKLAYTSSRHTANFCVEESHDKMTNAIAAMNDDLPQFQSWWDRKISDLEAAEIFKTSIAKSQANDMDLMAGASNQNVKQLSILMNLYDDEVRNLHGSGDYGERGSDRGTPGTLWSVYQAATAWATHLSDIQSPDKKKHLIKQKRQSSVAAMINSRLWKSMEHQAQPT